MSQDFNSFQEYFAGRFDELKTLHKELCDEVRELRKLREEVGRNTTQIENVRLLVDGNTEQIAAIQTVVSGNTTQIQNVQSAVQSQGDTVNAMQAMLSAAAGIINKMDGELTVLSNEQIAEEQPAMDAATKLQKFCQTSIKDLPDLISKAQGKPRLLAKLNNLQGEMQMYSTTSIPMLAQRGVSVLENAYNHVASNLNILQQVLSVEQPAAATRAQATSA